MIIKKITNDTPKTFFSPKYEYYICEDFLSGVDFTKIGQLILQKEKIIIDNTYTNKNIINDGGTGLGTNSLTSRYRNFNLFFWPEKEILNLREKIKEKYVVFLNALQIPRRKVWMQCWANVLRKNEEIKMHLHQSSNYCYLGGHVMINCHNTSTFYVNPINQIQQPEVFESKNEIGKITFFQNNIPHFTNKNFSDQERISIAFDIFVDGDPGLEERKHNLILFDE